MSKYDNSGSLSKNQRKEKDTHPDVTGKATVDGVDYWISGWRKEGKDGAWYSLAFERKDKERDAKVTDSHRPTRGTEDDPIPF